METDNNSYPKILVVNHDPFNTERNNGMTMSNLFRGWPKDRLAQVYLSQIAPSFDVCCRYWKISEGGVIRGTFRMPPISVVEETRNGNAEDFLIVEPGKSLLRRYLSRIARKISPRHAEPLREVFFRLPAVISKPMLSWIREFQPDAIYSMMGTSHMLRLAVKLSEEFNIPFIPHFTDDWPTTQYLNCFGGKMLRRNMHAWLLTSLRRAPARLVIGDMMAEEYTRRYKGHFEPFMNCLDASLFPYSEAAGNKTGPVRFVYIGGLHLNRWQSLQEIGRNLEELKSEGFDSELVIYTYPYDVDAYRGQLTSSSVMKIEGWVPNHEVPAVIQAADVLVHVESFDEEIKTYTRFSVSTKIPEYMIAGRCLFAYGPGEVASIRYISESGCGITVGSRDGAILKDGLRSILADAPRRLLCGSTARATAMTRHEAAAQRDKLRKEIIKCVNGWPAYRIANNL